MVREIIFGNSILKDKIENHVLNQNIINKLKEEKNKKYENQKSNVGGFQTNFLDDINITTPIFSSIQNLLKKDITFEQGVKLTMPALWINENNYRDFNHPHVHNHANFSGVYFVQTHDNCGNITFHRGDLSTIFTDNYDFFKDVDTFSQYSIKPEKGLLLVFPANLIHHVEPNLENKSRISVAFNLCLNYEKKNF